jgi:hypothetical protein
MQPAETSGFPLLRAVATILLWLTALAILLATLTVAGYRALFGDAVQRDRYEGLRGRQRLVAEAMLAGDPLCSRLTSTVRFTEVTGTRLVWSCRYRTGVRGTSGVHGGHAICDDGRWRAEKQVRTWRNGLEDAGVVVGPECAPDQTPVGQLP